MNKLGKISALSYHLHGDKKLTEILDFNNSFDKLMKIRTAEQVKEINILWMNNKYEKLIEILTKLNFKKL